MKKTIMTHAEFERAQRQVRGIRPMDEYLRQRKSNDLQHGIAWACIWLAILTSAYFGAQLAREAKPRLHPTTVAAAKPVKTCRVEKENDGPDGQWKEITFSEEPCN